MNQITLEAIRSILKTDPSISPSDRLRLLSLLRNGRGDAKPAADASHLVRRAEAARRLAVSVRTIDNLASSGALPRRKLPGRVRAVGFLESDVNILLAGKDGQA